MKSYCNMNPSYGRTCQEGSMRANPRSSGKPSYNPCENTQNKCYDRPMPRPATEVECVCKVKKGCHKHDPMEHLEKDFPPVMAYVPWQQWGELYDADCGLIQGTIFKDLNYIFCGVRC